MKRASQSFYFLTFLLISFSLMTSTSEVEGKGAYVTKIGKKHPNGSYFRNSKTAKCIVDISDINAIGSQDLGLYNC